MGKRRLWTHLWLDSELEDGYVRVEHEEGRLDPILFLSEATYRGLNHSGAMGRLTESTVDLADGDYRLPRAAIDAEAALDLQWAIELADPAETGCVMGCSDPVVDTSRGYPLCARDRELLDGWDSLTA